MLKERDEIQNDAEWVLNEALNGRHLQSGGTFQNVLCRRIDEILTPIFAALLAIVDQYSNLNLLSARYIEIECKYSHSVVFSFHLEICKHRNFGVIFFLIPSFATLAMNK